MFCRKCGKQISDASSFCEHCGATVTTMPQQPMGEYARSVMVQPAGSDHIGSMGPYLIILYSSLVALIIGIIIIASSRHGRAAGGFFIGIGAIAYIAACILFCVLLYQIWRFVINESIRQRLTPSIETPGKAVGFMFIPFYNFYWIFQAFGKLPKDLNALARAKGSTTMMSEGLGMAIPILLLLCFIPFIGYIAAVTVAFILYPIFFSQATRLCREIA